MEYVIKTENKYIKKVSVFKNDIEMTDDLSEAKHFRKSDAEDMLNLILTMQSGFKGNIEKDEAAA